MRAQLRFTTHLDAPPEAVWRIVSSMEGVNAELGPWLRMTHPRGLDRLGGEVPLGTRLFRSWLLLFGVLPIDYDDLTLVSLTDGRGFREESTMATMRAWIHERTLTPVDGGTVVEDRLELEPRVGVTLPVLRAVVTRVFRHRHARLRARFGGRGATADSCA